MNPFLLSARERLVDWKKFRETLEPKGHALKPVKAVVEYFSQAPLGSVSYDIGKPDGWPTIWEMVSAGNWCRNSIAIGMIETLRLAGWEDDRLKLRMIADYQNSIQCLIVVTDDRWFLNYEWNTAVWKPDNLVTIREYTYEDKKYS